MSPAPQCLFTTSSQGPAIVGKGTEPKGPSASPANERAFINGQVRVPFHDAHSYLTRATMT